MSASMVAHFSGKDMGTIVALPVVVSPMLKILGSPPAFFRAAPVHSCAALALAEPLTHNLALSLLFTQVYLVINITGGTSAPAAG